MGGESPVVELYDSSGNPLAVQNSTAIPANTPALMLAGSDGTNSRYLLVDSLGRSIVSMGAIPGNIDAGNSTTTPLSGSGTFAGTGIDVSGYGVITVFVFADQAGTLNLEFSTDNTNWDDVTSYAVTASSALSIQIGPQAHFFRAVYQNGGVAQTVFRLQTIERSITSFPETITISAAIDPNGDALLTKSIISGRTSAGGGGYVDVKVTPSGALITDDAAASTTATTSVAASASSVTLLATNTSRLGATIWNESTTETLYLKLGSTASLTSYTAQLFPSGYYEVPYGYTGRIDGIWTSAVGNARITELT